MTATEPRVVRLPTRGDQEPPDLETEPPDDYQPETPATAAPEPAHVGIERALLGLAIAHPDTINQLADLGITAASFHEPAHATLWNTTRTLHTTGQPVTALAIDVELERRGAKNDRHLRALAVPAAMYAVQLIAGAPYPEQASWYAAEALALQARRRDLQLAERLTQLAGSAQEDAHSAVLEAITEHLADDTATTSPAPSTWAPLNLAAVDLDHTVTPQLLARTDKVALLYPGAIHSISGEPESGKSWVAAIAGAQQMMLGNPILMVDFEDHPARIIRRFHELGVPYDVIHALLRYIRPDVAITTATLHHLDQACDGTTLAILDGVTEAMTMHGLSLMDNEDAARYLALLPRRIADRGAAVVQIDHVVKNADARGRYAIGAQHKLAGIDGAAYKITVTAPFGKGKRGHARITIDKDREGSVRQHAEGLSIAQLTLDSRPTPEHPDAPVGLLRAYLDPPDVTTTTEGAFRPTHLMAKVSTFLESVPGATGNGIEMGVKGNREAIRAAVRALTLEGHIRAEPGKRGATNHYIEHPFQEDE